MPPRRRVDRVGGHPAAPESAVKEPTVPKMKTNRAAAKRFRITGTGRVRRSKGGGNHGMQEKSRKRLRRLRKNDMVSKSFEKRIKLMLPYG
jgi:large subunit ribosomal protein L35